MKSLDAEKIEIFRNKHNQIKHGYTIFFMILISVENFSTVRIAMDGKIAHVCNCCLAGAGILLFAAEICLNFRKYKNWGGILRFLFMCVCVISMIVNRKYGIVNNLKTLCWTAIQFFVLAEIDEDLSIEKILRYFRQFSEIFSGIWTLGVIFSLRLFVLMSSTKTVLSDSTTTILEGFLGGRLYGVFHDPNFASLCSCAVIIFAICNLILANKKKKILNIVYHAIVIFLQISYVILSGSRTSGVCFLAGSFVITFFLVIKHCFSKPVNICLKVLLSLVCGVFAVMICLLGGHVLKTAYSYVPGIYASITADENKAVSKVSFTRADVVNSDDVSNGRFQIWKDYIKVFKTTPIVGTSPRNALESAVENFPDSFVVKTRHSVHNTYLALFVCTGVLGAAIMLAWLLLVAIRVLKYLIVNSVKSPNYPVILMLSCIMMIFALAAFPLQFMFFTNTVIDVIFWVTLGFLMTLIKKGEKKINL